MKKSYRDDNGEKVFRYSIRKYHFGAASVAVAALMFFANGAVAASETITPATTSEVATVGSDGNSDGDSGSSDEGEFKKALPEQPADLKPADELKGQAAAESKPAQEVPQAEGEKEQELLSTGLVLQRPLSTTKQAATTIIQPRALKSNQSDYDLISLDDDEDDTRDEPFSETLTNTIQPRSNRSVTVADVRSLKVEAKRGRFGQVKGKPLIDGDDPANYIKFKNANGEEVQKPSGVDVTWERKPNTAVASLNETGIVKVTYHVADGNGEVRDEVRNVTISTPVYHATLKQNPFVTTYGREFISGKSAKDGRLYISHNGRSHFRLNEIRSYWEHSSGAGSSTFGNVIRQWNVDFLGKRREKLMVRYPRNGKSFSNADDHGENYELLSGTFIVKPVKPSVTATALNGKAGQRNQQVTVNNVTPGTTVYLYDGETELGHVDVPKGSSETYASIKDVTMTLSKELPYSSNIRAKVVYMPDNNDQRVESEFSASAQSTTRAPQAPTIKQNPEDLTLTSIVGQEGSNKATLTYTDANGRQKTVGFTKTGTNWNKDDANADSTISILNGDNGQGEIRIQAGTAQEGSIVAVNQKTATSAVSDNGQTKVLGRLEGLTNVAQEDGSVEITVPDMATKFDLTYRNQKNNTTETLHYSKDAQGHWGNVTGITADGNHFTLPKDLVADGESVSVIASNDDRTTVTVESKAKFEQPSATTSATRQNGDVEVTLPTDAEDVTLTYKNKQNTSTTVTLTKEGTNWTSKTNLPDGVSLANGKVTFDYTKVNRDTAITTASTRGKNDVQSQANSVNHNIPEHTAPTTQNVVIAAGATPTNEQLATGVTVATKPSIVAKNPQTAIAAGTTKVVATTLTYQDGSSETVNVTVISKPTAPTVNDLESRPNVTPGLLSTARTISGQAMPGVEKVKLTLQNGSIKEIIPEADGSWTYELGADEFLTQTSSRFNAKYTATPVSLVQVKNNVESEATNVGVVMGRAIIDTPLQAGRKITVHIPHDTTSGYIRIGGTTARGGVDIGLKKVGDTWTLSTDADKANKLELVSEADPDNQAMTKVTLKVKDNSLYSSPFTIGSERGAVKFRAHLYNGGTINQPIAVNRQADLDWILSETPTNTKPTVKLTKEAGTETPKLKDNHVFASPTVDELKGYFEGSDVEDDNGLTVGYAASNVGRLRVRVFRDRDTSANRQGTSVSAVNNRIPAGNYTLVLSTLDAAGAESNVIEKNIVVKTMADFYRDSLKYPTEVEKATFGNDDLEGDNFKQEAKTRFADKVREANQGNTKLPENVTYTAGNDNEKARTVVANFSDGSTIDISHTLVAKPTKPTFTPTEGQGERAKLSDTDRVISGTALLSATKVTIHFQDGRGAKGSQDVTPVNGRWSYNLPSNRYLRQTDDTTVIGSSSVPLSLTQTVFDAVSDKENIYVVKHRNFEGRTITQPKGSEELKALKTDAKKGIKYTERDVEQNFPSDFEATWLQTPDIDIVGKRTYKVKVTEKEQSDTSRPGEYDVTIIVTNPKPVKLTYENKDNGTTRIKLPTDADTVMFTIPKGNRTEEYTLTSKNNWELPSNSGITRDGDYLVLNSDSVDGNRQVTAIATKGEGELKSKETPTSILVPTHEVEVTKITKKVGESTTNEELLAAIDVVKKKSAALKDGTQYPTTVGNYDLEVMVTYADDSTEIGAKKLLVAKEDKSGLTTAKEELADEIVVNADTADKPQSKVQAYETAKQAAETAKSDAEGVIGNDNATADQVREALRKVGEAKTKLEEATTALNNAATTPAKEKLSREAAALSNRADTTNKTPDSVTAYNNKVNEAQNDITQAQAAAQAVADKGDNATATEVSDAQAKVAAAQAKLDGAKKLLVAKEDKSGLTTAKNALDTERNKAVDTTGKTTESVTAYNDAKDKAKEASDAAQGVLNNPNATEQQIRDEITKVNVAKDKLAEAAAGLVDKPTSVPSKDGNSGNTNNSANTNNGGITTPADSNSNSVTPDNSANTPAPSVTTDDSRNTTPATPSSTVGGQAQASTPAQETPVSPSTPNNSSNTATPSEAHPVGKSELARLVEELETRLKNLDGIDQSVIDAAKIILVESQVALRNTDLTEAGLKEITAKVKEALESLKGKQATKDEEEMKETRKEQGHLPYGTMIGSLLALLGLLLFLIARRKKESELKKLTKELTKVLQESDLTSADAKVLDQAREALAQAVAFLVNEKESDHTEDELIEKLKAILAQLR
ncbi:surface anchored protein [Streptococcus pneumoniae]|nr:surface anchored protein [Streptococcus pneumoniae]